MRLRAFITYISAYGLLTAAVSPIFANNTLPSVYKVASNHIKQQESPVTFFYGQFGVPYTLRNEFDVTLLSARYTMDPFAAVKTLKAGTDEKILVLDIAIKNAFKTDNWFSSEGLMSVQDEKGQLYPVNSVALRSQGDAIDSFTLKPDQGIGQIALNDPLQVACVVPAKARIVKIIINRGRIGKIEEAVGYAIAGATKEEAGEAGDPKNAIALLPDNVRDTLDKSGAVALPEGNGVMGEYAPSGYFAIRLDNFFFTDDPKLDGPAPKGSRYAVATVTAKLLTTSGQSMYTVEGREDPLYIITDSQGKTEKPVFYLKDKRNEEAEHNFKQGDEYTFRVVFVLPTDVTAAHLALGTSHSRKWAYDVSAVR